ncbi:hypothetical protein [Cellulosilyticum ruminicola]|uniref:hypothetical protein n=1 Tax=Cellulosilyticum ruminicola TaxID=425254 RepID=UPI00155D950A|nr:hypothetical protein [Cellulosilyticum ruminicola]
MLHYAYTKNESGFENLRLFCKEKLKNNPIYVYREGFSTNALIDDFCIVEALFLAAETFDNPLYRKQALDYANVLYQTNTTKAIVTSGYISDSFPLYYNNYNYETYNKDSIHIVQGLKTLLQLAEIDALPSTSLQWLKQRIAEGTLYGSYTITGEPLTDIQSAAAYALAARIAANVGDYPLYNQCIQRMEQYKITDKPSEMLGALGNAETGEAFSFDQLSALLAYDAKQLFYN